MAIPRRFLLCSTDTKQLTQILGDRRFGQVTREFVRQAINVAQRSYYFATETLFGDEGDPPKSWAALAPYTVWERYEMMVFWKPTGLVPDFGPEHPILQRTGRFKRSLTGGSSYHVVKKTISGGDGEIAIGTADKRFKVLHSGGMAPKGRVPARPVIPSEDLLPLEKNLQDVFQIEYRRAFRAGIVEG